MNILKRIFNPIKNFIKDFGCPYPLYKTNVRETVEWAKLYRVLHGYPPHCIFCEKWGEWGTPGRDHQCMTNSYHNGQMDTSVNTCRSFKIDKLWNDTAGKEFIKEKHGEHCWIDDWKEN
jgi:hypothetical protein